MFTLLILAAEKDAIVCLFVSFYLWFLFCFCACLFVCLF